LIFVTIELVFACLFGFIYLFQGIFTGAAILSTGESTTGALCMVIAIVFVLILIAIPGMKMKWGLAIHKSLKLGSLTSDDRTMLIALVVLCVISGGWIAGIMYIILLASWKDLHGGISGFEPVGYSGNGTGGSHHSVRNKYSAGSGWETKNQPGEAASPPGYNSNPQQYPDELNW
jgi:hypothetical protein